MQDSTAGARIQAEDGADTLMEEPLQLRMKVLAALDETYNHKLVRMQLLWQIFRPPCVPEAVWLPVKSTVRTSVFSIYFFTIGINDFPSRRR